MLGRKLSSNGTLIAAMVAVALVGGCDRTTTAPSDTQGNFFAAHVRVASGDNQSGPSNIALAAPVAVTVTDAGGQPVGGASIQFVVRQGGGTVSAITAASDSTGTATTVWTLGASLGPQQLVALLNHGVDSAVFSAVATSGSPAHILLVSGNGQVGRSDQVLPSPLVVQVTDASGKPLAGASVIFTQGATNPTGFTSANPVTTGADGTASVTWTLGQNSSNTTVPMTVVASLAGTPTAAVTFSATARPEYRIRRDATPFIQSDTTGATIGSPSDYLAGSRDTLRVQVFDPSDSSGVQGVTVTWAGLSSDNGHPVNASTVTDNKGFAKTLWVLLKDDGHAIQPSNIAKRMIATASMGQVEFQANVTPGQICAVSQDASAASPVVGSSIPVTATVRDCNGFAVTNASVSFQVTAGGGTVTPSPVFTDLSGTASTVWTLGPTVGPQSLKASATAPAIPFAVVGGASNVKTVTAVPVPPASIVATGQPASGHSAGPTVPITITVSDAAGNPMPGQSVVFAVTQGSIATSSPQVTGPAGTVVLTWTLAAGTNTLSYSVGSLTGAPVTIIDP